MIIQATLNAAIATLKPNEQKAVILYYLNDQTLASVAKEMECSRTYVDVLLKSGVRKLRARLGVRLHRVRVSCTRRLP